ncbi:unnamed protein product [Prorocentrum cordatum]|uniref:Uncharacterized protein n=1 Tax=Prorocentrum cordatum TaxID=2364126 RepID=A0ABN9V2J6_9DINO|nr:unnamed protein product [Polarella glacialis]
MSRVHGRREKKFAHPGAARTCEGATEIKGHAIAISFRDEDMSWGIRYSSGAAQGGDLYGDKIGSFYLDRSTEQADYIAESCDRSSTDRADVFEIRAGAVASVRFDMEASSSWSAALLSPVSSTSMEAYSCPSSPRSLDHWSSPARGRSRISMASARSATRFYKDGSSPWRADIATYLQGAKANQHVQQGHYQSSGATEQLADDRVAGVLDRVPGSSPGVRCTGAGCMNSPWERGATERRGGWWKSMRHKAEASEPCHSTAEVDNLADFFAQAEKRLARWRGRSPAQRVSGDSSGLPGRPPSDDAICPEMPGATPSVGRRRARATRRAAAQVAEGLSGQRVLQEALNSRMRPRLGDLEADWQRLSSSNSEMTAAGARAPRPAPAGFAESNTFLQQLDGNMRFVEVCDVIGGASQDGKREALTIEDSRARLSHRGNFHFMRAKSETAELQHRAAGEDDWSQIIAATAQDWNAAVGIKAITITLRAAHGFKGPSTVEIEKSCPLEQLTFRIATQVTASRGFEDEKELIGHGIAVLELDVTTPGGAEKGVDQMQQLRGVTAVDIGTICAEIGIGTAVSVVFSLACVWSTWRGSGLGGHDVETWCFRNSHSINGPYVTLRALGWAGTYMITGTDIAGDDVRCATWATGTRRSTGELELAGPALCVAAVPPSMRRYWNRATVTGSLRIGELHFVHLHGGGAEGEEGPGDHDDRPAGRLDGGPWPGSHCG